MEKFKVVIGEMLRKSRYIIEEIALCNHTSYYPYGREEDIEEANGYKWCYFYYYDDYGTVYRTKIETYNGVRASKKDNCEVDVEVVGLIPTRSNGECLFFHK